MGREHRCGHLSSDAGPGGRRAAEGVAAIPIAYGNHGLLGAGLLTVTATLDPALSYLSDIRRHADRQQEDHHLAHQDEQLANQAAFTLRVSLPNAAFGSATL